MNYDDFDGIESIIHILKTKKRHKVSTTEEIDDLIICFESLCKHLRKLHEELKLEQTKGQIYR